MDRENNCCVKEERAKSSIKAYIILPPVDKAEMTKCQILTILISISDGGFVCLR